MPDEKPAAPFPLDSLEVKEEGPPTDPMLDQVVRAARGAGYAEAMNDVVNAVSDVASAKHRSVNDVIYELLNRCSDLTSRGPTRNA